MQCVTAPNKIELFHSKDNEANKNKYRVMSAEMVWGKDLWKCSLPKKQWENWQKLTGSAFSKLWKLIQGLQQSGECLIKKNCRILIRMFQHSWGVLTFPVSIPSLQLHGSLKKKIPKKPSSQRATGKGRIGSELLQNLITRESSLFDLSVRPRRLHLQGCLWHDSELTQWEQPFPWDICEKHLEATV